MLSSDPHPPILSWIGLSGVWGGGAVFRLETYRQGDVLRWRLTSGSERSKVQPLMNGRVYFWRFFYFGSNPGARRSPS